MANRVKIIYIFVVFAFALTTATSTSADQVDLHNPSTTHLPAIEPLLNIFLPSVNTIYHLILNFLSALDSIPPCVAIKLPIDIRSAKASILSLYLQTLDLARFLSGLPKDDAVPGDRDELKQALLQVDKELEKLDDNGTGAELLGGVLQLAKVIVDSLLVVLS